MSAGLAVPDGAAELSSLYSARAALEQSRDLGEIRHIHDTALAAKRYAEAKKLGAEMAGYAQEIVNRAERKIGQLLAETPKDPGGRPKTGTAAEPVSTAHKQAGKKLSSRAQLLAELPDDDFERLVTKPVTRVARIARDRRAERRRIEDARAAARTTTDGPVIWREYDRWTSLRHVLLREAERIEAGPRNVAARLLGDLEPPAVWPTPASEHPAMAKARALAEQVQRETQKRCAELEAWLAEQRQHISAALREAATEASTDPDILIGRSYRLCALADAAEQER